MKRIFILLVLVSSIGLFFIFSGDIFTWVWKKCLVVSLPMEKADALIVLGGEPLGRPLEAARLFKQGVAPKVFVTGVGDSTKNRRILVGAGVPESVLFLEKKAYSTFTNATLLKPMLESAHVHTALIVTSPFHTRRALATFRKVIPNVQFGVTDASLGWWSLPAGKGDMNRFAAIEFLKTFEYWLLYGVNPISGVK